MLSGGAIVSNRGSFLVVLLLRFSGSLVPGLHPVSNEVPSRSFKRGLETPGRDFVRNGMYTLWILRNSVRCVTPSSQPRNG